MSQERTALIIGASGGIGRAVLKRLVRENVSVVGTFFKNETVAKALEAAHPGCRMLRCDVTRPEEVRSLVGTAAGISGRIDTLILCETPPLKLKPFESLSMEDFSQDMEGIFFGAVRVLDEVLPLMKKEGAGQIMVFLSSVVRDTPSRMASYTAAKSALLGLIQTLSAETRNSGVKLLGVSPYFVETELIRPFPAKLLELERQKEASGRFLLPEDLAELAWAVVRGDADFSQPHRIVRNRGDIEGLIR